MRARDLLVLALAAAGVLAYRDATDASPAQPPAFPAGAAEPPPPALPSGTVQLRAPRTGRELVASLLGDSLLLARPAPGAAADSAARNGASGANGGDTPFARCTRCVHEVDALVVTLPDPVRSTLDWAYDAGLEAVHRAHEQAGFVLDRFYLPWSAKGGADGGAANEPGVLLFRSTSADTLRLRLVYLIGELPTAGIHKDALHQALRDGAGVIRDLETAYGARHADGPLRVVGPALSGSSFSLAVALRGALADDSVRRVWRGASVLSGTATSRSNQGVLTWGDATGRDGRSSSTFAAMVYPDETLGRFQATVLQQALGYAPEDIAMLRESNTTYGRAAADDAVLAPAGGPVQVPFSMSIAVLRGELSRRATGRPAAPLVGLGGGPQQERVELDLTPTGVTTDHPAATSRLAAPLMDWMLDEIAQNLAAHRVRAVGIIATDSRDVLFLGSELRQRFRDVQLFTYGASGLFARADRSEWLQGMLVVSNYPLNMETQWWTGSRVPPSLLAFGSEIGVGMYNATLAQLGSDGWMIDARSPFRAAHPPPYWVMAVGRGTILPVAVVTDSLDTVYRPALAAAAGAGAPAMLRPARTRGITQPFLFFAAAIAVLWWLVAVERREQAEPHRPISPRTFAWLLGGWSGSLVWGLERQHAQYAGLRFAGVGALAIPAGLILAHRARHAEHLGAAIVLALSVLLFAAAVLHALVVAWRSFEVGQRRMEANTSELATTSTLPTSGAPPPPIPPMAPPMPSLHRAAESGAIVISIALSALFVVLAAVFTGQVVVRSLAGPEARLWEELFFTRATALGSGLSPFLPFLALSGIVTAWATWHLYRVQRLRAVPTFEPALRLAEDDDARHTRACARDLTSGGIPESIRAIRLRLTSLAVDRWGASLLLVVAALSVWLLPEFTFTFERLVLPAVPLTRGRSAFDILLTFGILASIWIILVGLYRLVTVWAALRRLLGELASTRLLEAFRRLPAPVARLTRLTPWDIPSDDVIHSAINEEWRELERLSRLAAEKLPAGETSGCGQGIATRAIAAPALDDLVEARTRGATLLALLRNLHRAWDEVPPDRPGPDGKPAPRSEAQLWLGQLEECVAVYVVDYVEWVLGHLRHLAAFVVTAVVLSVVLVSSYPFRPQALVKAIVFGLLVVTAAVLLIILYQLNRDELASNITKTDVGRVTWDLGFLLNISLFVLVPLLTLVSAGVPEVRDFLFSWVTPTLRTFSGG